MMKFDKNGKWKLYWGNSPLPIGSTAIGVITRNTSDHGALILLPSGNYVQGNAGCIRSIDQTIVKQLLRQIHND